MALESTFVPVPSEIVIPPAAFWAAQGHMSFAGVVWAGTIGCWAGSSIQYWAFRWLGAPFLHKYSHFFFLSPDKIKLAEVWVKKHGPVGIFVVRLLPAIRQVISIPAGILKMPFIPFSIATLVGSGIWCWILAWFGRETLGQHPELLDSPVEMINVIKSELIWFVAAVLIMAGLYAFVLYYKSIVNKRRAS